MKVAEENIIIDLLSEKAKAMKKDNKHATRYTLMRMAKAELLKELDSTKCKMNDFVLDKILKNTRQITVSECIVFAKIFGLDDFRDVLQKKN